MTPCGLVSTVCRDQLAYFVRFYSAYDAAVASADYGAAAAAAARRRHWEQVTSFESEALAFAQTFERGRVRTAASDLFEKL